MRIDVDKHDFACIIDALKQQLTKSQLKLAEDLVRRLTTPAPQPKAGWAPMGRIRPSWPDGLVKPSAKRNSYHHKPRAVKQREPKPQPTADEILSSL